MECGNAENSYRSGNEIPTFAPSILSLRGFLLVYLILPLRVKWPISCPLKTAERSEAKRPEAKFRVKISRNFIFNAELRFAHFARLKFATINNFVLNRLDNLTDGDNEDSAANGEVTQIFSQEWLTDRLIFFLRKILLNKIAEPST